MADKAAIAQELLSYEVELISKYARPGIVVSFTPDDAANTFVIDNPNAFLIAVIFDQGIPAERAWAAPFLLKERLGHFDLSRVASMKAFELADVIAAPPALHRYVNNVPDWIVLAARRIVKFYDGDASNIWNDNPTASDLINRLQAFAGIGQKKAAMATQILKRDMKVPIRDEGGTQIAFDAHIRRVFLRSGLTQSDTFEEIDLVSRTLSPSDPGALDLGAWYVGRNWCHPIQPDCTQCRLSSVCPKLIHLGADTAY